MSFTCWHKWQCCNSLISCLLIIIYQKYAKKAIGKLYALGRVTPLYKVSKSMSPPQITELFAERNEHPYNLRHNAKILQPFLNSPRCRTESISYLDPKIWAMVPDTYKYIYSLYNFKKVIRRYKPENCLCRIWKAFVTNIGFCEL